MISYHLSASQYLPAGTRARILDPLAQVCPTALYPPIHVLLKQQAEDLDGCQLTGFLLVIIYGHRDSWEPAY